jgi:hypothetical protein
MSNLIRKLAATLALTCLAATVAHGQSPANAAPEPAPTAATVALPSTDEVLKHYVAAIGGREAWAKLHTRVSKGTIEIPAMNNLSGTIEVHMKAPNSILVLINLGGAMIKQGFDGAIAWSDDPKNGLRELAGGELEDERRESDFYHALDLKKLYSNMSVIGRETIGDHDTFVVEATPISGGEHDKLYFDETSGLEVRSVNHRHTPEGPLEFTADIKDYHEVDGIKLPFTVEQTSAQSAFTIKFTAVTHNQELADSQFARPSPEPEAAPAEKQ